MLKYFYKGIPLVQYCEEHDIDNTSVRKRIRKLKAMPENANLTDEEITTMAIKAYRKKRRKYYVSGVPLREYCTQNNIIYGSIIGGINRYKKEHPNSSLNDDQIVELITSNYLPNNTRYYYENESLVSFCLKNNLAPSTVIHKLYAFKDELKVITIPFMSQKKY